MLYEYHINFYFYYTQNFLCILSLPKKIQPQFTLKPLSLVSTLYSLFVCFSSIQGCSYKFFLGWSKFYICRPLSPCNCRYLPPLKFATLGKRTPSLAAGLPLTITEYRFSRENSYIIRLIEAGKQNSFILSLIY